MILFPGPLGHGFDFYGDPRQQGLEQIGFTDHFYPGLFGSPPTVESHVKTLYGLFDRVQSELDRLDAPMLAGEFNVVPRAKPVAMR